VVIKEYKEIVTIEETDLWKVSRIANDDSKILTISFSSSPRIGESVAKEEFIGTASQTDAIFIIDKTNSFGNSLDWEHIANLIKPYASNKIVRAIGFCMGGFLSVVLSRYISMQCVIAITPQYSIMDGYIDRSNFPADMYTDKVSEWKIPTLDGYFVDKTNYYVMYTHEQMDLDQIKHFPKQKNVFLIDFGPAFNHGLPGQLGDSLELVVGLLFKGRVSRVNSFIKKFYSLLGKRLGTSSVQ
jgi:predicted esterase YcpF (UPF0227 family)